jgi:hypothetical protein
MPTAALISLDELENDVFDLDLTHLVDGAGQRNDEFHMSDFPTFNTCDDPASATPATCGNTCTGATGKPCAC